MKVLLTATVQSHIVQFHKPLVEVLHNHGCEVHVAARNNLAEKNGLKLDFVDKVFDVPLARSPKSTDNIKAYKQLKQIIDAGEYDVIHCNTPVGGIVTRLAAGKARRAGARVFYTAHGFHFYKGAPKLNWLAFYPLEKFFSRFTDVLITITNEDYELATKKFHCQVEHIHGVGVSENRYHPVSREEQLALREKLGFTSEQKVILCVGELLPNKNQQMAIRAMTRVVNKFPDAQLVIAGNGPEKENLEKLIGELHLEQNVKLIGYCTYLEKYQRIADILVACSIREGLPLNIVEALLSGVPVVASNNRGHRELINSGTNGFIVGDSIEMSDKIIYLLSNGYLVSNLNDSVAKYTAASVKKELRNIYF